MELQRCRGDQGWTESKLKNQYGHKFIPAYKVFDEMPERNKVSKFENSFGGSHLYIHRSGMVVVVVNLVKKCRMAKVR
jgi:hypothetical protein